MRIALGTAQFGLAYGEFNNIGQVPQPEVERILTLARAKGVTVLDTAHAYGDSETVLGKLKAGEQFSIVTKIPALPADDAISSAKQAFGESLARLGVKRVYGLLLHRATDLLGSNAESIWRMMMDFRERGLAQRIGFSAYGTDEARSVLEKFPVDLIQVPLNVFDNRYADSQLLARCGSRGIEVHARSAFLQGFVFSNPEHLRGHLRRFQDVLTRFRSLCTKHGLTPLQAALRHVLAAPGVNRVVVGVERAEHLDAILQAAGGDHGIPESFQSLRSDDVNLIDPSKWH